MHHDCAAHAAMQICKLNAAPATRRQAVTEHGIHTGCSCQQRDSRSPVSHTRTLHTCYLIFLKRQIRLLLANKLATNTWPAACS
jgi:hypothetical protein